MKRLIDLLLTEPHSSNQKIAQSVRCDRRRVRRYRQRLAEWKLSAEELSGFDGAMLKTLFDPRTLTSHRVLPDFDALAAAHPNESGRMLWDHYRQGTGDRPDLLSYSQFMRRLAEHRAEVTLRTLPLGTAEAAAAQVAS
jgi:hypothetical protein